MARRGRRLSAAASGNAPVRVLVADDSRINQKVVGAMLERMGVDCDLVSNGGAAVDAAAASPYSAILMDCQMPGIDGYQATARIRAREGAAGRTPVIAMTASASAGDRERCLAAGMDDCLAKPFTSEDLARMLERWTGVRPGVAPPPRTNATRPPAPDGPLETSVLADLRALGSTFARDSLRLFLGGTPERIDALAAAVQGGNHKVVKEKAHILRGSCGVIGARRLTELCAEIEGNAGAEAAAGLGGLVAAVRGEYRRVAAAVEDEIKRLG